MHFKADERALTRGNAVTLPGGLDHCNVRSVDEAIRTFGKRSPNRASTEREGRYADESIGLHTGQLALKFATKNSLLRVMRPIDVHPDRRSIQVVRRASGSCELSLSNTAGELAAQEGIEQPAPSVRNDAGVTTTVIRVAARPRSTRIS